MDENKKNEDAQESTSGAVIDWKKGYARHVGQPDRDVAFDRTKKGAGLREDLERISDNDSEPGADGNIGGGASPGLNRPKKSNI
jgi:hypothetical protein